MSLICFSKLRIEILDVVHCRRNLDSNAWTAMEFLKACQDQYVPRCAGHRTEFEMQRDMPQFVVTPDTFATIAIF